MFSYTKQGKLLLKMTCGNFSSSFHSFELNLTFNQIMLLLCWLINEEKKTFTKYLTGVVSRLEKMKAKTKLGGRKMNGLVFDHKKIDIKNKEDAIFLVALLAQLYWFLLLSWKKPPQASEKKVNEEQNVFFFWINYENFLPLHHYYRL